LPEHVNELVRKPEEGRHHHCGRGPGPKVRSGGKSDSEARETEDVTPRLKWGVLISASQNVDKALRSGHGRLRWQTRCLDRRFLSRPNPAARRAGLRFEGVRRVERASPAHADGLAWHSVGPSLDYRPRIGFTEP
jgi:hypothetical protein